ncbi:MAG: hypothetical protein KBS95_02965 [Alistipes sp.]|nr:hypothetical protein [Candidatus Alistipes equi]
MKKTAVIILFIVLGFQLSAQNENEIIQKDIYYYNDFYREYPVSEISNTEKPPKGYKPVYISHLGRHGSRYHTELQLYSNLLKFLEEASKCNELTDIGKKLLIDWREVCQESIERGGDLTPQGMAEHEGIAQRMFSTYPKLFGENSHIICKSTLSPRCIMSMGVFSKKLQSLQPKANIEMEASPRNQYLKSVAGLNAAKGSSIPLSDSIRHKMVSPIATSVIERIVSPSGKMIKSVKDKSQFAFDVFLGVANSPHKNRGDNDLAKYLFTPKQRSVLAMASNVRRYILSGPNKEFLDFVLSGITPLVKNVILDADEALKNGKCQANLRFGHDVTIIAFTKMLGIKEASFETDDYTSLGTKWLCSRVSPMASNAQLIFYKNSKDDILVKILFCEREQELCTKLKATNRYYYKWNDFKQYLLEQIKLYDHAN